MGVRGRGKYQRQVVYCTTRLPNTGPMLNPLSKAKMYMDVKKLFVRPACHTSLTIPDVMFASVALQLPVMIRTTIRVAKFLAKACGIINMIITA